MTEIKAAYDNIRLIRRKVLIAQAELDDLPVGRLRDAETIRLSALIGDLVRALNDFADMGYEEEVANYLPSDFSPLASVSRS